MTRIAQLLLLGAFLPLATLSLGKADEVDDETFAMADVFQLEWASDPQIAPDGTRIVYVRNFMDIMSDRRRSNLWIIRRVSE